MTTLIAGQGLKGIEYNTQIPTRPVVVMFSGFAGTGKSFSSHLACNILDSIGSFDRAIYSIAYGVKKSAKNCFGWDGLKGEKGRQLLQNVGRTGRMYDEDMWIRQMTEVLDSQILLHDFIFVDDWRFPNEESFVRNLDRYHVYTVRIHAPDREILKGTPAYDDVSEQSLPSEPKNSSYYDFWLDNNQDEEDLKARLTQIILTILENTTTNNVW